MNNNSTNRNDKLQTYKEIIQAISKLELLLLKKEKEAEDLKQQIKDLKERLKTAPKTASSKT